MEILKSSYKCIIIGVGSPKDGCFQFSSLPYTNMPPPYWKVDSISILPESWMVVGSQNWGSRTMPWENLAASAFAHWEPWVALIIWRGQMENERLWYCPRKNQRTLSEMKTKSPDIWSQSSHYNLLTVIRTLLVESIDMWGYPTFSRHHVVQTHTKAAGPYSNSWSTEFY